MNYSASQLSDSNGNQILKNVTGTYSFWSDENIVYYVPKHKILGGYFMPYYSVHGIGVQANYILPAKNLVAFFKYYDEYSAKARVKGRTIVFGFSWRLRIPKAQPAKP
jgi:hypothetical protein